MRNPFLRLLLLGILGLLRADRLAAETADLQFAHLSIAQGLSQSIVDAVLQDRQGFIWFVTEDGLNRYDAYGFTVFKHDANDPFSLAHNEIKCIEEDREGYLWVGSFHRGLERFDPTTSRFTHYQHDPDRAGSLGSDIVWSLLEDRRGRLWVGTGGGGLNLLDRSTGTFTRFVHDPANRSSLSHDDVRALCEDRSGALWVGTTGGGLNRLDPATAGFTSFRHAPGNPRSLSDDDVRSVIEDRDGSLWIATHGGGLNRYDPRTGDFTRFRHDPRDPRSLSTDDVLTLMIDAEGTLWAGTDGGGLNRYDRARGTFLRYRHDPYRPSSLAGDRVYSLLQDRSGILWVGTYGTGVSRCDINPKRFLHYSHDTADPNTLSHNIVWSVCEEPAGVLWIGTNDGGLDRLDRATGRFTHHLHDPADPRSLGHNSVRMVAPDRSGQLWLATNGGGLDRLDPRTGGFTHYRHDAGRPGSLSHDELRMVLVDRSGTVWVGTYGGGLDRWDPATDAFIHYRHDPRDPRTISNDYVRTAFEDASGTLWFGTHGGGLNRFDRETGLFTRYRSDPRDPSTLSNDFVFCIHEDRAGGLWVATYGGGLNRLDRGTGTFAAIRKSDGLPDDVVYGILEDSRGCLWLSTNSGISRYDPDDGSVRTYTIADGLQSNEFNGGSYYRNAGGEMFFGGINGFNVFVPEQIRDCAYRAPVVFTDFQLSNQPVPLGPLPDGRAMLERSISSTRTIELSYRDRVVSFEFAALDFASPEKNLYRYRLAGLQKDWIDLGNRRFVMFTTLPAGRYVLEVKGTNRDGVWNEQGAALALLVHPPWWRTVWAYCLYGLSLVGIASGLVSIAKARERTKSRLVEAELRAQAAELQSRTTEAEAGALKSENDRKSRELEEARRFQLSMLPTRLPRHPLYATSARMRTATEVGGDYYDFRAEDNGTLTVAIGDAMGHGTRAGIMVAIMKGLFSRMGAETDLRVFLRECNLALRDIELDPMLMGLGLLRLTGREARFVAAAMPPLLIHRRAANGVEEVAARGMMLGTEFDLPYEEIRFTLGTGDRVLLVSDGYLEQLNPAGEMLDPERCRQYFQETAERSPGEIIEHLLARFDDWRGAAPQGDDVTLVVIEADGE